MSLIRETEVAHRVFEHISAELERFCRDKGATLTPWYHDEPRWLLRWEDKLLRQVEVRVEGQPGDYNLVLIPGAFESGKEGGWRTGQTRAVAIKADPKTPSDLVDLVRFVETLEEAFRNADELATSSPKENRGRSRQDPKAVKGSYERLSQVLLDQVAIGQVENAKAGWATADAAYHAFDTLRNLSEVQELRDRKRLDTWFFHAARVGLSPRDAGALLGPYIVWENDRLRSFKLAVPKTGNVCGFDSAIRLVAGHLSEPDLEKGLVLVVKQDGHGDKDITVADLDEAATEFINKSKHDGFIAEAPGGHATLFSTFAAVEVMRNLASLVVRSKNSHAQRLLMELAPQIEVAVRNSACKVDAEGCAFRYEDTGIPCLSAGHYGLRTLESLNSGPPGRRDGIERLFKGTESICEVSAFLRFLKHSWNPRDGGFSCRPYGDADLVHTRHALQILRTLLSKKLIGPDDIMWLNAAAIADFVLACYSGDGFAIAPGQAALLFTTRVGVNCFKLLEILRLRGIFIAGRTYLERRDQLLSSATQIREYVSSCQEAGQYRDSPLSEEEMAA